VILRSKAKVKDQDIVAIEYRPERFNPQDVPIDLSRLHSPQGQLYRRRIAGKEQSRRMLI
jgi:hypothetical protein